MADNKKYYWLKLKQDFFDNLRMKKLRSIAGGDTYTIIYLKMQLLSLQEEGMLYYEGVEDSFEKEIALIINENVEDVKVTISFLLANNLLKEVEQNKYELIETKMCIGSETTKAEFMRRLREKRNNKEQQISNNVTLLLPDVTKCYTDIDIDKEIYIDKNINKNNRFKKPTLEEIKSYIKEKDINVNAEYFFDYFETGNWKDSKGNQVKNWKQKLLTWNRYSNNKKQNKSTRDLIDEIWEEANE